MKLRIEPSKICFRLDFEELEHLLAHGEIQEKIALPHSQLIYKVIGLPNGSAPDFQVKDALYALSLPKDMIEDHKAALPSMDGIIYEFPCLNGENIKISLEINLKKSRKRAIID